MSQSGRHNKNASQVRGEDLIARAKAIAAKLGKAGITAPASSASAAASTSLPVKPAAISNVALPDKDEISRRVEEARRLKANAVTQVAMNSNPYIVRTIDHRYNRREI